MAPLLPALLATLCSAAPPHPTHPEDEAAPAPPRTVMAWIEGDMEAVADFVLRGAGKGAVNAVSHTSVFRLTANTTSAELIVNQPALANHSRTWQQGTAKQLGIRTYPCIGYGGNISGLRTVFQPENQRRIVREIAHHVQQSDVDGTYTQSPTPLHP